MGVWQSPLEGFPPDAVMFLTEGTPAWGTNTRYGLLAPSALNPTDAATMGGNGNALDTATLAMVNRDAV